MIEREIVPGHVKILEIRKRIYDYATDNRAAIENHEFFQRYGLNFDEEIKKIYDTECDFDDPPIPFRYCFQATFVLPVASLAYKMKFGTYHLRLGTTEIFEFTNNDGIYHQQGYSDIRNMGRDYNMIAFNGENHFYYLKKH